MPQAPTRRKFAPSPRPVASSRPASPVAPAARTPGAGLRSAPASGGATATATASPRAAGPSQKPDHEILFQKYFKSVGPRTYAAQLKRANNGNEYLVLTEGKREDKTGDVRKTRVFVYSEDFVAFFRMLHETAQYIREHPVSDDVRQRRERHWAKQNGPKR